MISVLIPLYNNEHEICRAIDSVLRQSLQDYEIIVVDDGSTDKSPIIVDAIRDPRIRLIRQENQGVSAARNRGIMEAKSDLIAFIDADDEWLPTFLTTISNLRKSYPRCALFATNYVRKETDQAYIDTRLKYLALPSSEGVLHNYFQVASESDPPICSSAVAVHKKALLKIGGFPVGIKSGEDLLTWARLACLYDIAYSSKPAAIFWHSFSLTNEPRMPEFPDIVALGLSLLNARLSGEKKKHLMHYISSWHRMRTNSFIKLGKSNFAQRDSLLSIRYNPISINAWGYFFLSLLPVTLGRKLLVIMSRRLKSKFISSNSLSNL